MESKYKVGDKVRIKSLEWYNSNKDIKNNIREGSQTFLECMSKYCGKEYEIYNVISGINHYVYKLYDTDIWCWEDWMFEEELSTKEQQALEQLEHVKAELDKYQLVNRCQTIEALENAIMAIGSENNGMIHGRTRLFSAKNMSSYVREVVSLALPANLLTRNYGIRQQALYLSFFIKNANVQDY